MKKTNLFTFNELATKTGIPQQTIRNWEKDNLIKPAEVNGNRKLFDKNGLDDVVKISKLRQNGCNIGGIKEIMAGNKKIETKKPANRIKKNIAKINYGEKSITELTEIAKMQGVKYFRQMNKGELVEALQNPNNAKIMSEQAKVRTKERYGDKAYGKKNPLSDNSSVLNIKTINKIISLNKQGLNNKEIFEKISK